MKQEEKKQKIGIVGGTFDPIHIGHLLIGETAKNSLGLDLVIYIPSGCSYMKEKVSDATHRYHMTKIATEGNPDFTVSDIEIKKTGPTYTFETMIALKETYPDSQFFFIVGADIVFSISSWKNPNLVLENVILAVFARDGFELTSLEQELSLLEQKFQAKYSLFHLDRFDVSSSDLRMRLMDKKSVKYLIPDKVIEYIHEYNLYE